MIIINKIININTLGLVTPLNMTPNIINISIIINPKLKPLFIAVYFSSFYTAFSTLFISEIFYDNLLLRF